MASFSSCRCGYRLFNNIYKLKRCSDRLLLSAYFNHSIYLFCELFFAVFEKYTHKLFVRPMIDNFVCIQFLTLVHTHIQPSIELITKPPLSLVLLWRRYTEIE